MTDKLELRRRALARLAAAANVWATPPAGETRLGLDPAQLGGTGGYITAAGDGAKVDIHLRDVPEGTADKILKLIRKEQGR